MAIRKKADRFVLEFQQRGVRVFRRLPPGVTKAQAQEYETKLRREIFDGELGKREELTLPAAIGLWLQNNRRKNQRQAESEARQWEPFVAGRLLREAPEVAQEAIATWCHNATPSPKSRAVGPELATAFGAPSSARALHKRRDGPKKDRRPWTDSLSRAVRVTDATAPATVNRRLALIKAVCKHAWRQKMRSPVNRMCFTWNRRIFTPSGYRSLDGTTPAPRSSARSSYRRLPVAEHLSGAVVDAP